MGRHGYPTEFRRKVLDLVAAKPIHLLRNHQKTVTALALASGGRRVVAGGLDGASPRGSAPRRPSRWNERCRLTGSTQRMGGG